jgi:hypothetical protein
LIPRHWHRDGDPDPESPRRHRFGGLRKERKRIERELLQEGEQVKDAAGVFEESDFDRFEDLAQKLVNTPKPKDEDGAGESQPRRRMCSSR